ncbi:MAG: AzlC family ABC transporter permease [Magnetospirillum sp.]|nr:AzlC family ABC transporter permease [Magnetospirillum sp.]
MADGVSLIVGYFSIAVSFGILAVRLGFSPGETVLVSAVVYAGASQFALVTLLAAGASPLSVAGAVAAMNLRHLFYGPALLAQLPQGGERLPRPLLAFGMTDEVFALASGSIAPHRGERWLLGVQVAAYGAWLVGTVAGAHAGAWGGARWPAVDAGLAFVLPALFLALLAQSLDRRHLPLLATAAGVALLASIWLPGHAAMLGGMVAGALVAAGSPGEGEGR